MHPFVFLRNNKELTDDMKKLEGLILMVNIPIYFIKTCNSIWRRKWDLNPCTTMNDLLVFEASLFSRLSIPPLDYSQHNISNSIFFNKN